MPQPNRHKESLLTHAEAMRLWYYDSAWRFHGEFARTE